MTSTPTRAPVQAPCTRWPKWPNRLLAVEAVTALAALGGGALLVAAPDGSLLNADPAVLDGSPFADWRIPGLLLVALVGGGYALTAAATAVQARRARQLTVVAGAGLMAFEACELWWIGPQPLEAVFAAVGAYLLLSTRSPSRRETRPAAGGTG